MMMDNPVPPPLLQSGQFAQYPDARFVTTRQDHFDDGNKNMWQQAYFVNDAFWVPGSDGPIFLCVGGEGPALDGSAVVHSVHCNNAVEWLQEKKALMFAIEHRYYGCHNMSACPVSDFSDQTKSLKFLSSRQAVEDVANFVHSMNKEYRLTKANKWVTWGGSYPGMMAGWSRTKHPELIHASVASSAPVKAQLDMPEYNNRVAKAYSVSDNGVGGSQECEDAIRKGHSMIGSMFTASSGQKSLEETFGLPSGYLSSRSHQSSFAGNGVAYFPSQGNDPTCTRPACNIKRICEIMVDESKGDEVQRLAYVRKATQRGDLVESNQLPDFWSYQTCNEFGFYQTCEVGSDCFYTQGFMTLDDFTSMCSKWGISPAQIEKNIENTNKHYGGRQPTGTDDTTSATCVMWPNGEVDPWAGLSVLQAPSADQPVLMIGGASHHAWTHPSAASDQASVVAGRLAIRKQVEAFLASDCSEKSSALVV
jgi:hypothetical protein